jgi:hypothetical protein
MTRRSRCLHREKKPRTGRMWVYVRDDTRSSSTDPAAIWFAYSLDHKGIPPQTHLAGFKGIPQADAYGGSTNCMRAARFVRRLAGITRDGSYTTFMSALRLSRQGTYSN